MKYNIGDKLICRKEYGYNLYNPGEIFIINYIHPFHNSYNLIRYDNIGGIDIMSNSDIEVIIEYFETIQERRKRLIKEIS